MEYRKNKSFLPSRKVLLFAAVLAVGGLVFLWIQSDQNFFTADSDSVNKGTTTSEIASLKKQDSDSDGLNDWEEQLWGTDPKRPDTDEDGTDDGQEVNDNRDPSVAGPDDRLSSSDVNVSTTTESNVTRTVVSEFLPDAGVLAAAKQEGQSITQSDLKRVSSQAVESRKLQSADVSLRSDLTVTVNYTPKDVDGYFDKFAGAQKPVNNPNQTNPLTVVAQAMKAGNQKSINLSPYISQHQTAINRLKSITVPDRFVEPHLKTLQSLERALFALKKLNSIKKDPIGSVVGIQEYKKAIQENQKAAELISQEVKNYAQYLQSN